MFTNKSSLSPESNPIDLLRKYSPYLIGIMVSIAIMSSLYYIVFKNSKSLVQTTEVKTADALRGGKNIVYEAMAQSLEDALS
jgi:hypothetical protein